MSIQLFFDSIKSPQTRVKYSAYLKRYGHNNLKLTSMRDIEQQIIQFIINMKKQGKNYYAISNYVNAIISYYRINDVPLNTKKIIRFMPERRRVKKDRAYTHEEISKLLEIADKRMRAVILLLSSSGIRIGAIPSLRLRSLDDMKLLVYENDSEEYLTFITPECKKAIDSYLDMRSRYGEKLTDDSYLIREQFDIRDQFQIKKPNEMTREGLQWMIKDIAKRCGVRTKEKNVPLAHGFRKFFTTQTINSKVNPEIREMLLGHKIGLASCYYRPTEQEMYEEYEKAIDLLTIDPANRLQRKIETLIVEKSRLDRIEEKMKLMESMFQK
jgi:integrase